MSQFLMVGDSELWFTLAPKLLPPDAEARFVRAHKDVEGGFPMPAGQTQWFDRTVRELRSEAVSSDSVLLFNPLTKRTRWFAPSRPKPVPHSKDWGSMADFAWSTLRLSPDDSLMVGMLSGSGSTRVLEKSHWGTLFVWDFRSGRMLWQRAREHFQPLQPVPILA